MSNLSTKGTNALPLLFYPMHLMGPDRAIRRPVRALSEAPCRLHRWIWHRPSSSDRHFVRFRHVDHYATDVPSKQFDATSINVVPGIQQSSAADPDSHNETPGSAFNVGPSALDQYKNAFVYAQCDTYLRSESRRSGADPNCLVPELAPRPTDSPPTPSTRSISGVSPRSIPKLPICWRPARLKPRPVRP